MVIWLLRTVLGMIVLGWLSALWRSSRAAAKQKWVLGPSGKSAPPGVPVSVIIPARNEEENIERCVRSVLAQDHANIQLLVFDDASTDSTPDILEQLNQESPFSIVTGDGSPLPEGWFGKPWALQRAQQRAVGEWLLFIDADVELSPQAVSRTLAYARDNELNMVTGLGFLEMETFWEKVLQPAIGGLILAGNSLSKVNNSEQKNANFANGQFILVSRNAYNRIGRHASVKTNILDDIGLARALVESGAKYHCLFLTELFRCRMYTTFGEIWEGWTKNLFAGMRYSLVNVFLAVVFTFAFSILGHLLFVLGVANIVGIEWLVWGATILLLCQSLRLLMDVRRGMEPIYGLTHAPASLFVIVLILRSALHSRRGSVTWKGRTYQPQKEQS